MYCIIDFFIGYYIIIYLLINILLIKNKKKLSNIDNMWFLFKKEFKFKLLNNNNFFLKALNFYQNRCP